MGSVPVDGRPIKLNGAIFIMCGILKFVVASAAEAELQHEMPSQPQHSPYRAPPKVYGTAAREIIPDDVTAKIDEKRVKAI